MATNSALIDRTGSTNMRSLLVAGLLLFLGGSRGQGVTTLAGSAGSSGSADGAGATARFHRPFSVTAHPDGALLFVADDQNHLIRQIVIATGVVTKLAGSAGSAGSTDGTGPHSETETTSDGAMRMPSGCPAPRVFRQRAAPWERVQAETRRVRRAGILE
jgi:hypothetical protein